MLSHVGVKCFSSLVSAESKFSVKSNFLSISLRFCGVAVRGEEKGEGKHVRHSNMAFI
jgi:hypothetical protein